MAMNRFDHLPAYRISVDAATTTGPLETWRHGMGQGGINAKPLPDGVIDAVSALRLPLIRIFLQQYLDVLQPDGTYDWRRIDAYVGSFAKTGKVMAAFCLKPPALFPKIDQRVLLPGDIAAWEALVEQVARRYAGVITHWEIGNESDIGESGGCPYLIEDDDAYNAYYKLMAVALLRGDPHAMIGGSAVADANASQLPSLIAYCRAGNAPLDFISWHLYSDDPEAHAARVIRYRELLSDWPGKRPLTCVTEWAASFPSATGAVPESADEPFRAASYFATVCRFIDEGLDHSFFYHLCDNTFYHDEFRSFFGDLSIMDVHWNWIPHRFGVFGHDGRARPHYQLWRMLRSMGGQRLAASSASPDLVALAGKDGGKISVMVGSFNLRGAQPVIADVWFDGLEPGVYQVVVERLDGRENLSRDGMALDPIDVRDISTEGRWRCPVYLPPYAVARISLEKADG